MHTKIEVLLKRNSLLHSIFQLIATFLFIGIIISPSATQAGAKPRTGFQSWAPWKPEINLPLDIAMVYSTDPATIASWRDHGYTTWVMFGASWLGKNEEIMKQHPEIAQRTRDSQFEMIPGRAWVVPVGPWIEFEKKRVSDAITNGALGILPEEPEFFASTGYSDAFKTAWKEYYNEPWRVPHASPENQWLSNQLKAHLFTEFYRQIFLYAKSLNPNVKCLIPTHSNLNYTDWNIVTPHYAYAALPESDGFVAQAWTGTAKNAHLVGGEQYRSSFNYSFLEYSSFAGLLAGTNKDGWFLTDPVEDAQGAPWADLRNWFEDTLISSMMFPEVNTFENVPWPDRVFMSDKSYGDSPIPQEYATELLTAWSAEGKLPASGKFIEPVTTEIGFLTSDTAMWQRGLGMDRFNGFAAPMLTSVRSGIYARVLPAERFAEKNFPPNDIKVAVASFDAWKPRTPETVAAIADWVKRGGVLLYIGGADDYDDMPFAWWKKQGFETPADALLDALGLKPEHKKIYMPKKGIDPIMASAVQTRSITPADGAPDFIKSLGAAPSPMPITLCDVPGSKVLVTSGGKPLVWEAKSGKGAIVYAGFPGEFVSLKKQGVDYFMALLRHTSEDLAGVAIKQPGALALERGPFVVARGLNTGVKLDGPFINLLRPDEPVAENFTVKPGQNAFLMRAVSQPPAGATPSPATVLLASGKMSELHAGADSLSFTFSGPSGRNGYAWILIDRKYKYETDESLKPLFDEKSGVLRLTVPLSPEGAEVNVKLK